MKTISVLLLSFFCALLTSVSKAGEIENLSVIPQSAKTGQLVEINIVIKKADVQSTSNQASSSILGVGSTNDSNSKNDVPCAVLVNFGDGHTEHIRVNRDSPTFNIPHTYNSNGTYAISVEGKHLINGFKSVFGCSGNTQTTVLTVQNNDTTTSTENLKSTTVSNNSLHTTKIETKGVSNKELLKRGIDAYQSKQYEDANIFLSAGLKTKPRDAIANLYLGLSLKELNQKDLAIKTLRSTLKMKLSAENHQLAEQALLDINTVVNNSANGLTQFDITETPVFILDEPSKNNSSEQIVFSNSAPQHISFNQLTSLIKGTQTDKAMSRAILIDYLPPVISEVNSISGTKRGKKVTSTQEEPNPAWEAANQRMINAQNETKKSVQDNERIQAQLRQSMQAGGENKLTALITTAVGLLPIYSTNKDYAAAKNDFDSTPRTISKPIYSDYSYPIVNKDIKRVDKVIAYLIDFNKGFAYQREFKKTDSAKVVIAQSDQNIESSPREKDELRQSMTKIEGLKDKGRQPILLKDVIEGTLNNAQSNKPIGNINNLPDKISRLHTNATLESKKIADQNIQSKAKFEKITNRLNNDSITRNNEVKVETNGDKRETNKSNNFNATKIAENTKANCIENFESLAAKYPTFQEPELQKVKDSITAQTVKDIISSAKSQGFSADEAINASILQANEYKKSYKQALACAVSVDAFGNDEEDFIAMINRNKNVMSGGIRDSCLAAAIGFQMGYMHAKTIASALVCNKRRGTY